MIYNLDDRFHLLGKNLLFNARAHALIYFSDLVIIVPHAVIRALISAMVNPTDYLPVIIVPNKSG